MNCPKCNSIWTLFIIIDPKYNTRKEYYECLKCGLIKFIRMVNNEKN